MSAVDFKMIEKEKQQSLSKKSLINRIQRNQKVVLATRHDRKVFVEFFSVLMAMLD